ncbi:MAG: isoprenylcysteine carboxylmethyltransferase family protein [Proteobacteria bacterium]|nr:isoprenylcysteine carboxylmethyltransferase family protein [Pseudomonadota bacterium]
MTADSRDSFLLLIPPPVQYAAGFGFGLLAEWLVPWRPAWMQSDVVRGVGGALVAGAIILAGASVGLFLSRRTTVIPHGRPSTLVTDGPFAVTRNPMYVAMTVAYCGAALMIGRVWPLVFIVCPLTVLQFAIIPSEERRLRRLFGRAYEDYCQRVRRWL